MADESRLNVSALTDHVNALGGEADSGATPMDKVYRAWIDVKTAFTGKNRKAVIDWCEHGEDQSQKAYNESLDLENDLDGTTRELITRRQT